MAKTIFSLEVFPPKRDDGIENIYAPLRGLCAINPDFISVTCSAGGSAEGLTVEVCDYIRREYDVPAVAHLTCAGSDRATIKRTLSDLRTRGIDQILALRGDLAEGRTLTDYRHATDLISDVVSFGGFSVMAACYPEGHKESARFSDDLDVMKRKEDLGATHFLSQLFFDERDFLHMLEGARKHGVTSPIEAGIMPVTNAKQIVRMVQLSGAKIPEGLAKRIARYEYDPEGMRRAGIEYVVEMSRRLLAEGVDGLHLYAMNNADTAKAFFEGVRTELGR
ncbi:MAG: methylenetetrahydrofolate reductase [Clostridia bacterium]|nr:methylenetetrahydrofolate reductase [Clostridia bacterium]